MAFRLFPYFVFRGAPPPERGCGETQPQQPGEACPMNCLQSPAQIILAFSLQPFLWMPPFVPFVPSCKTPQKTPHHKNGTSAFTRSL